MRGARSASAAGVAALLITLLASSSGAQDGSRQRAPSIRVYSQNGAIASRYVTPAIEVSEDAYVFAVSLDLDGKIQILHPDYPGISIRILKHKELRLPNFFAGFSPSGSTYAGSGGYPIYSDQYVGTGNDSRGTVIALASRAPFNLERVESDGDWNISAIRSLVENHSPAAAARALAAYLGAKGETIGTDYMIFAAAQYRDSYTSNPLYECDLYYGGHRPSLAISRLAVLNRVTQLRQAGRSVRVLGYDFCGMPIVAYGPSQSNSGDRIETDGARGRMHPPHSEQSEGALREPAIGDFPMTQRPEMPYAGDVLIAAPRPNRRDPREIFNDPRNEGLVRESAERSRSQAERNAPHAATPMIGTFPTAREYPRPIVREAPRPAPGPAPAQPSKH
jgi:hypothetical protein